MDGREIQELVAAMHEAGGHLCGEVPEWGIIIGCGGPIWHQRDVYRCTDCMVPFHRQCAREHFGRHGTGEDLSVRQREAPRDCQHEPPYPGADTVVMSIRAPDTVAHLASPDCAREEPHPISECGRFRTEGLR